MISPQILGFSFAEKLDERFLVQGFSGAVYPAKTKRLVNGFTPGDARLAGFYFKLNQPDGWLGNVVVLTYSSSISSARFRPLMPVSKMLAQIPYLNTLSLSTSKSRRGISRHHFRGSLRGAFSL